MSLSAIALLSLGLGACTSNEEVTPVRWQFLFGCKADSARTDAIKLRVAKGECPLNQRVIFETSTSTWDSTISRPQGMPEGQYAFQASAVDAEGRELASTCISTALPMEEVISLDLQPNASCQGEQTGGPDGGPDGVDASGPDDGGVADASPSGDSSVMDASSHDDSGVDASGADAGPCATWWRDMDKDGFGDPLESMQACAQPSGYVANSDDCADADPALHPNVTELCDLVDSDCDGSTTDGCPEECTPKGFADRLYLVCAKKANWSDAALVCTSAAMSLVHVDSDAENEFLYRQCFPLLGAETTLWIGATDAAEEGVWRWTSGTVLWRGGTAANGGLAENSAYTKWKSTEPGGGASENCGQLRSGSLWNDGVCDFLLPFVCEQVP